MDYSYYQNPFCLKIIHFNFKDLFIASNTERVFKLKKILDIVKLSNILLAKIDVVAIIDLSVNIKMFCK